MKPYLFQICLMMSALTFLPLSVSASPISNYERKIVAAVLVLEASSEGVEGMQAVLNVIYNRAGGDLSRVIPVTVKKGQFSSINSVTGKRNPDYSPILRRAYQHNNFNDAMELVRTMERGELEDITFGATHYHTARGSAPYWVTSLHYLTTIGGHHFYTNSRTLYQAGQ